MHENARRVGRHFADLRAFEPGKPLAEDLFNDATPGAVAEKVREIAVRPGVLRRSLSLITTCPVGDLLAGGALGVGSDVLSTNRS